MEKLKLHKTHRNPELNMANSVVRPQHNRNKQNRKWKDPSLHAASVETHKGTGPSQKGTRTIGFSTGSHKRTSEPDS